MPADGAPSPTAPHADSSWWDRFTDCLNNAGVPAWLVTGVTIACSIICIGTVGTGCPVCILAAAGGYTATIEACMAVASQG